MPKIITDEQIFRAVMKVVSKRGYAGATTKQMADAAEVSEVTLFRKFENKAQLVKQSITYVLTISDFRSVANYSGDVHADLLGVVEAYQEMAKNYGFFFFALFSEFSRHPELAESMKEPMSIFQNIGELVARYQSEGVLKQEHPLHAVATLLAPIMYILTIQNAGLEHYVPELDFPQHVTYFLEGHRIASNH